MDRRIREAWLNTISPDDYDAHMAAVGQAQANAELVAQLLEADPPTTGASILFVGAGTGQLFDYQLPGMLTPFQSTFADINAEYLERLRARIRSTPGLHFDTVVDNVESSSLTPGYELVVAVLVLEHVDWRKAIATMCRLSCRRVFVVIQENPPDLPSAMTKNRPVVGSMRVFLVLDPQLVPRAEVEKEFRENGLALRCVLSREVLDSKRMVGLEFERIY
jgi:2-polyprenyl-3-methyl-5-hydroxy-6-metoxy-1,4-benzoquinol methylase